MEILVLHFLGNYQAANAGTTLSLKICTAISCHLARSPKERVDEILQRKPMLTTSGGFSRLWNPLVHSANEHKN